MYWFGQIYHWKTIWNCKWNFFSSFFFKMWKSGAGIVIWFIPFCCVFWHSKLNIIHFKINNTFLLHHKSKRWKLPKEKTNPTFRNSLSNLKSFLTVRASNWVNFYPVKNLCTTLKINITNFVCAQRREWPLFVTFMYPKIKRWFESRRHLLSIIKFSII